MAFQSTYTGEQVQAAIDIAYKSKYTNEKPTLLAVGGIPAGVNFADGITLTELMNQLFYPPTAPIIQSVTTNLTNSYAEMGNNQNLTKITVKVIKQSNDISTINLLEDGQSTGIQPTAQGDTYVFTTDYVINNNENKKLQIQVIDSENLNAIQDVTLPTFVYPYYWGVCDPDAIINEALVKSLTKSVSPKGNKTDISFTCTIQRQVFAYPAVYGALKSINDPSDFGIINSFSRSEVSITGQAYYVYVSDVCSVTDFKIDFKY